MARIRLARHPKPAETETQKEPEPEAGGQEGHGFAPGNGGKITKSEAVRRAIAAGAEQPAEGVPYIRDNFGLEITPTHFSAVKTAEKKKGAIKIRRRPGRRTAAVEGYLAPPPKPVGDESELIAAMEAMKPLVASLGAEKVKRLADLLG